MNCTLNNEFIFFGCWNESYCDFKKPKISGSSQVINYLLNNNKSPKFYIVAGDNYYPRKDKEKELKEFSNVNFNSGFKCLEELKNKCKTESPIYMLMGNHDLQYENGLVDRNTKTKLDKCHVLTEELKYKDIFHFNKHHIVFNNSLIIFIISTLYTNALGKGDKSENECINKLKQTFSDKPWDSKNLKEIIADEEEHILKIIDSYNKENILFKNIIVCGHDPIVSRRNKHKDDGIKKIKDTLNKNGIEFLNKIYSSFKYDINKCYLCADVHQFQKCNIKIGTNSLNQYVVGTGGTTCDEECVPIMDPIETTISEEEWKSEKLKGPDTLLKYFKLEECERAHGYLVGKENSDGIFEPYFQKTGECIDNWKIVKNQIKYEDQIMKSSKARSSMYSMRGGKKKYIKKSKKKTIKKNK